MTPESLIINSGFRTIRIDSYVEYLTKKPTCRDAQYFKLLIGIKHIYVLGIYSQYGKTNIH